MNSDLRLKINSALESIRPFLQADGGDVELVSVSDDLDVQIKLLGNCCNCGMKMMTMKAGIEDALRSAVPSIKTVVDISDKF
ncbi:MAG: NifU family protein [Bacteroidia bacterium]